MPHLPAMGCCLFLVQLLGRSWAYCVFVNPQTHKASWKWRVIELAFLHAMGESQKVPCCLCPLQEKQGHLSLPPHIQQGSISEVPVERTDPLESSGNNSL